MLSQMQPHFLYNVFTTISSLCEIENATQARDVVNRFADYFRANLDSLGKERIISFKKELEHIETYLWLEKLRFEDRLNVSYQIGPVDFDLPSLLVQPIVENAVKHGILPKGEPGTLTLSTREYQIIVEDERLGLTAEAAAIKRVLPNVQIHPFQRDTDALLFSKENKIDIAFLDININGITGLSLAEKLQEDHPTINIIFCTGYSEYSLEAHDLYCSAYLMKPITDEKIKKTLAHLRHPLLEKIPHFKVLCFGNFEVYKDKVPIKFKHKKTKELFAYLIDRRGATASTKDIMAALYEDDNKESYI